MYRHDRALILSGGGTRGAYEIGVWKYLCEVKWQPDLICGTWGGEIKGAAITAGLSIEDLIGLWKQIESDMVTGVSIFKRLGNLIRRREFTPYMDTRPLRSFLESTLNMDKIRNSDIELVICAVNLLSSKIAYFNNSSIAIDHIMASSAIPVVFPWQYIDGKPHWDGGVMANTPIAPALERDVSEIVVVLLSPVGGPDIPLPRNHRDAVERMFEHALIGSYEAIRSYISVERKGAGALDPFFRWVSGKKSLRIATVAPCKMLGFHSMLNFSNRQSEELIDSGYRDARDQLADFFSSE